MTETKHYTPKSDTVMLPTKVFYDSELVYIDKAIYLIIQSLDYGQDRSCFASNDYIARSLDISERYVQKSLKKLEERKHISKETKEQKRILKPLHALFGEKNSKADQLHPKKKKTTAKKTKSDAFTPDTADVLRAFAKNVNPDCETMYNRKAQREAAKHLIDLIGKDKLINKTIPSLAEWNNTPYLTKDERAFTPTELKSRMARIMARMKAEQTAKTKKPIIII